MLITWLIIQYYSSETLAGFLFRNALPAIILGQQPVSRKANAVQSVTPQPLVVQVNGSIRAKRKCM